MLGGGRADLEKDFGIGVTGETSAWKLALTPKSQAVGKYVRDIVIEGAKNEPRCIIVTQPDDESSLMLVGKATESKLPAPLARDWLISFCAKG